MVVGGVEVNKIFRGLKKAESWWNNADLHIFPLQRALDFANVSSPLYFLRNPFFFHLTPYPVISEVNLPPVMKSPCESFTGDRSNG